MTELWPRLPAVVADKLYTDLQAGSSLAPSTSHADQTWAPIGGRVSVKSIQALQEALTQVASAHGYPATVTPDARIAFDRAAASAVRQHMDLSWSEAGARDLWSFTSLIALPHLTSWRFGHDNRERWIASDLTRHTWARLWWQAVVFAGHDDVLAKLSESDLNQLLERRSIGGDPRLVVAAARAIVTADPGVARRLLIRDVGLRLLRYLAFMDIRSLDDDAVGELCGRLVAESVRRATPSS